MGKNNQRARRTKKSPRRREAALECESNQRQAQAEATRQLLLKTARSMFATVGYHATSTEDLVARAGVTRGALYHHFRDKLDLFEAVFEQIQSELTELTPHPHASTGNIRWIDFRKGAQAYLDLALQPDVQRIVLIDGPSVLGWARWRNIQLRYGLQDTVASLQAAMDEGLLPQQPAALLAHLLLAAFEEAALMIAHAESPRTMRKNVGATLDRMLENMTIGK